MEAVCARQGGRGVVAWWHRWRRRDDGVAPGEHGGDWRARLSVRRKDAHALGKSAKTRMWAMTMRSGYEMAATLYCCKCGLEAPIEEGEVRSPCTCCGGEIFATLDELGWLAKLTYEDKRLLKKWRIAIT